jgi:hypothetical protein
MAASNLKSVKKADSFGLFYRASADGVKARWESVGRDGRGEHYRRCRWLWLFAERNHGGLTKQMDLYHRNWEEFAAPD